MRARVFSTAEEANRNGGTFTFEQIRRAQELNRANGTITRWSVPRRRPGLYTPAEVAQLWAEGKWPVKKPTPQAVAAPTVAAEPTTTAPATPAIERKAEVTSISPLILAAHRAAGTTPVTRTGLMGAVMRYVQKQQKRKAR